MKLCTFIDPMGEIKVGAKNSQERIIELTGYRDMKSLIECYSLKKEEIELAIKQEERSYPISEVKLKAPILNPEKLIFIGLNYRKHAIEANLPEPEKPILFAKFNNSLVGTEEEVTITQETSKCDYEAELAFVVGKTAKNVPIEKALGYVFGYTACNDVSARDLQLEGSQWIRGKAIDTFAPMGPFVVTADEITNPHNLSISCKVNGEIRQNSNTGDLIFDVPYLLSFLSQTMTLQPGDIISTGTPSGVAMGMNNPVWLKPGDTCEVEIENIGILRNKMINDGGS